VPRQLREVGVGPAAPGKLLQQVRVAGNLFGQRRTQRRIEPAKTVVTLGTRRIEVIANAEVQSQLLVDLPCIVD